VSTLTLYLLGAINLGIGIYSLRSTLAYRRYARSAQGTPPPSEHRPSVVLFVPCCGAEDGLEENLRSLVEQEYGPLDVVFIVEDDADSAVPVIRRVIETGVLNPPAGLRQGFGQASPKLEERRRAGARWPRSRQPERSASRRRVGKQDARGWGPRAIEDRRQSSGGPRPNEE
jgi:cellulose synthase/poly-beta-1,6-N-acetylglucosamine synthase-like glycosyltransferase